MKPTIGWIGLGNMGRPMVSNLLKAGYEVTVYNRTAGNAAPLVEQGAKLASSPKELAEQVELVITMVSDADALQAVLAGESGVLAGVRAGQTVIDMSTVAPDMSRNAAAQLLEKGVQFLDAPVSGSVKPATDGTLVILVGGDRNSFDQHVPIFEVLGKKAFYFGPNGAGASAKLAINMLLGISLQGLSEALVLGAKAGLDRATLLEMIGTTACASPIVALKTQNILADQYQAAFALKHMEKDFGLALEAARKSETALPATAAAHQTFVAAKANGHGEEDIMAILLQLEQMSGLR
ncbi:NAD(P)-dependent oxidoreductase [Tumebacillus lipolyticus]|uniref:NAD(P)-dependent oxidoreductase n=1 Tax=Tumebacillus lipolyticus TaxID=1280370 RepID=A0ABW4ZTK1_9BACL